MTPSAALAARVARAPGPVRFAAGLADHGGRLALVEPDGTTHTYAGLARRVIARAAWLGATRRLVAVEAQPTLDALVTYLAALSGGHPVMMVPPGTATDPDGIVAAYDPDVVAAADAPPVSRRLGTSHLLHPELASALSTSGTTGSPKLVRLSAVNLDANATAIATALHLRPDDVAITSLPLSYCYGLSVLHSHLRVGAAVVLTSLSVTDPCFWAQVERHGVTGLAGVPYTFDLLDRIGLDHLAVPSLRRVTQAGGRLAPERVRALSELGRRQGWDLYVMYGQTEATARMAVLPPSMAADHPGSVGRAVPGGSFTVERRCLEPDPDRRPNEGALPAPPEVREVPDGEVGELVYHGPNVMLGYAESPADLALGRTVPSLRTGDLARRTPEGLIEIVGRAARFTKLFGLRVDLDRVEAHLADRGDHVVAVGDDTRLVVARRIAADGADGGRGHPRRSCTDLRRGLAEHLGLPVAAVVVVDVDDIPRGASGKPDARALLALADAAPVEADADAAPAGTDGRATATAGSEPSAPVRALVATALDRPLDHVDPADSFVVAGGDSLSYVEVSVGLEELLGPVPSDWHLRPLAELDELAARHHAARSAGTAAPASSGWRTRGVDTTVALRAVAIGLIVATHAGAVLLQGGAHVLLAVAGWNFARFRLAAADLAAHLRGSVAAILAIAVPTVAWLSVQFLHAEPFTWPRLLLVNNYLGSGLWEYWYLEALLQILVVATLVVCVPAVRRAERRRPFAVAMVVLVAATALRYDALDIGSASGWMYRPDTVLWCFAFGWAAHRATTAPRRLAVTAVGVVCLIDFFDRDAREILVGVGLAALLWLPSVRVPAAAARLMAAMASASLWIYLTHWAVLPPLRGVVSPWLVAAGAVAVGLAAHALAATGQRAWGRRRRARTTPTPAPAPAPIS